VFICALSCPLARSAAFVVGVGIVRPVVGDGLVLRPNAGFAIGLPDAAEALGFALDGRVALLRAALTAPLVALYPAM
jgi:hypothetical protein